MLFAAFALLCLIMPFVAIFSAVGDNAKKKQEIEAKAEQEAKEEQARAEEREHEERRQAAMGADALIKYKQLLDDGTITQDEFDALKSKLMESAGVTEVPPALKEGEENSEPTKDDAEEPLAKEEPSDE